MTTKVQKWGNSLAVRIPKSCASEAHIEPMSTVEVSVVDGKIVLAPVEEDDETLEDLVARITDDNMHGEYWLGPPMGREEW